MAVEMGAKCGLMEADKKVLAWIKRRSKRKAKAVFADKGARYEAIKEFDVSRLSPQVARPHTVDNVAGIEEVKGKHIDEVYIGTCTNGRLEDFETAAKILRNKKVHPDVKLIVAPASRIIYLEALKKGIIDLFVKAGGVVLTPGCGPCVGTGGGIPADGEVVISTANRNFKGRMGNPNAFIYLASPATCAASALEGKIADPRKYL
jgi:3-isopropylmalate/(R)-2-methylmalate dehydratase large subunit